MISISASLKRWLRGHSITLLGRESSNLFFPDFDRILQSLVASPRPIIFDIGANEGQSIERMLNIFQSAKLYSFEPIPSLAERLSKKFSAEIEEGKLVVQNLACGNSNTKSIFYVNAISGHSSLLKLNNSQWLIRRSNEVGTSPENYTVEEIDVSIVKLDTFVDQFAIKNIDVLKVDTQGTEIEVLQGAKRLLSDNRIGVIQVEVIHNAIYNSKSTFFELEKLLESHEYRLVAVSNGGSLVSSYMFQQDLIYVSNSIYSNLNL